MKAREFRGNAERFIFLWAYDKAKEWYRGRNMILGSSLLFYKP